jgi:hypothetical protein
VKLLDVPGSDYVVIGTLVAAAAAGSALGLRRLSRRPAYARR